MITSLCITKTPSSGFPSNVTLLLPGRLLNPASSSLPHVADFNGIRHGWDLRDPQFHDDLVADINRFADSDVFPFLDKARLERGYIWNQQLIAAASDSAIFVPVLSRRFFQSDYCQKELRAFIEERWNTKKPHESSRLVLTHRDLI